ncbi:MAG: helix-turn-helix domain-containing protein [Treponema sp.]|jgi:AraC-like DNA-binding protein/ligand-binding sensor protein|nr:helix-turn-helix domain-containing protein [Treponema sp.]
MSDLSIIRRRELDPLLARALEVLKSYEKATDCPISVLGPDFHTIEESKHPKAMLFCTLCKRYCPDPCKKFTSQEYPCTDMHLEAIKKAQRLGGSYIYTCAMGFIFWTSPIYAGQRFAGALMSSGIIAIGRDQATDNVFRLCGGDRSREEVESYLENIPQRTYEEVKALAQMMLHCAEQLSNNAEDAYEPRKRYTKPEPRRDMGIHLIKGGGRSPEDSGQGYPLDKERMLLASLRRGDNEAAKKILGELLNALYNSGSGSFEFFRLRAMELVVLLSRAAASPESADAGLILEANNRYLKKIADSQNIRELTENLHAIVDRMAGKIFSFQGIRHSSALRKAERHIWENYTRKISLQEIAEASGLSAPYFSTIFKEEMGENLSSYLNRLRIEKAATMLAETELTLNEIAGACGFEDQSWFSKIFKNFTGLSPGKYREKGGNYIASFSGGILSQVDA